MSLYLDKTASLSPLVRRIICEKATEYPHSGAFLNKQSAGTYLCRRCGLALFRAEHQFHSGCGWPSFDGEIQNRVQRLPDSDGHRTEIVCSRCQAHLGHVFIGEYLTMKNLRHCVNSVSLDFVPDQQVLDSEEAILGGGCFWGVDYYLRQLPGVLAVEVGYCGGHLPSPNYQQVCGGRSGHYEVVRVLYNPDLIDYSGVVKRFFEIHDPTQTDGQGPDLGHQYQSVIFYYDDEQRDLARELIHQLKQKNYPVVTRLLPMQIFWPAEDYHQAYYLKNQHQPYCHRPVDRFGRS